MNQGDSYDILARHYDAAYASMANLADCPFYVELAKQFGRPVLEIGCGTGRILLRIAREGIEIDGVDNSAAMLRVLKARLDREPAEIRERVKVHQGDMRSFRLAKKYALAIMPFRPMQHMHTLTDQVDALKTAAAHLCADGRLAFDVFYPKFEMLASGIGQEVPDLEWMDDSKPAKKVRRFFRKDSFDKFRQNFSCTFVFRTYEGDKLVLEEKEAVKMSYYTYPQLRALFLLTGLEPIEEYGSFSKAPIDNNAEQMIFVLRRTSQQVL